MTSDYRQVSEALAKGADPEMLCFTCPWDRYCISPPSMTAGDVKEKMKIAEDKDNARDHASMPVTAIINMIAYGTKDLEAMVCPVFAIRLRSSAGRGIVDNLKLGMKNWSEVSEKS